MALGPEFREFREVRTLDPGACSAKIVVYVLECGSIFFTRIANMNFWAQSSSRAHSGVALQRAERTINEQTCEHKYFSGGERSASRCRTGAGDFRFRKRSEVLMVCVGVNYSDCVCQSFPCY